METIQRVVKRQRKLEYVVLFPRLSMHESNLGKRGRAWGHFIMWETSWT